MAMLPLKTFLSVLFQYAAEQEIGMCYARYYTDNIFQQPQRDIDIVVLKKDIPSLMAMIKAWPGMGLVGAIHHATNTQLFIYGVRQGEHSFVCLDLHDALSFKGQDYLKPSAVLLKAVPAVCGVGQQADINDLALIYLFTNILKHKTVSPDAVAVINKAYQTDRETFTELLEVYFGYDTSRIVSQITDHRDTRNHIRFLRKAYLNRMRRQDFLGSLINTVTYYASVAFQRITNRHDVRIVVIGTDGAGKTQLINQLKPHLAYLRPFVVHAHLKPVLPGQHQPDSNRTNSDPHAKPDRSWFLSNLKLIHLFALYWLDAIWPRRGSRVVIYDRYITDILVDPRRFRFAGSAMLAAFLLRHLPRIHAYIGLTTPPIIAYKRKPEVPLLIMQKQYEAYQQLISLYPRARGIDGTHITDDAVRECLLHIALSVEATA